MSRQLTNTLLSVFNDRQSGSLALQNKLANTLVVYFSGKEQLDTTMLLNALEAVKTEGRHFAVIHHFCDHISSAVKEIAASENPQLSGTMIQTIAEAYDQHWEKDLTGHILQLSNALGPEPGTILLHSNSSTIHRLMEAMTRQGKFPEIIQTISGPGNEGLILAEVLASMGLDVQLIHETAAGCFFPEVDCVILGADIILPDRFSNKAGSMQLALQAGYYEKPIYVIADSRKTIDLVNVSSSKEEELYSIHPMPSRELAENLPPGVKAINYYFEWIPNTLINKFFV